MLRVKDLLVRLRAAARAISDAASNRTTMNPVPGALGQRLGAMTPSPSQGGARPIDAAIRSLRDEGLRDNDILDALGADSHWFHPFMRLVALGDRRGVWDARALKPEAAGPIAPVWTALAAEGPATVLAVYLQRFLDANGKDCFERALTLMNPQDQAVALPVARDSSRRDGRAAPLSAWSDGEEELEDLDLAERAAASEQAPRSAPSSAADAAPDAGRSTPDGWIDDLLRLNVNQCTGARVTSGWLTSGDRPELYLVWDQVPPALRETLKGASLIASEAQGQHPNERGFSIRAGKIKFNGVVAIDMERLRRAMGSRAGELPRTFYGAKASTYEVTVLGPCGPAHDAAPKSEPAAPPCPRCKEPLRRKEGVAVFWVCGAGCGFATQAGEDGMPAAPRPCTSCGGPAYPTLDKKRRVRYACLQKCQKAKEAA